MKYDVVIVGAGSAGCVLASRLSEDPNRSVILIEAGPDYPDIARLPEDLKYGYGTLFGSQAIAARGSKHDWDFVAKATDKTPPMHVPRGKVTGGTSAINVQAFLRGLPEDYEAWSVNGNDEWSFENLLPYFRKMESDLDFKDDFHGTNGPITVGRFKRHEWIPIQRAFYQACRAAGFQDAPDMNHPESTGIGPLPFNNVGRIRLSTAITYLDPSRHRLNLTIKPNVTATRVVFKGKKATGVEVISDGQKFTIQAKEVILSSGAIGSPHLLLLSGVGPAEQLSEMDIPLVHDLCGVGKNLRDHPEVFVIFRTKRNFKQYMSDPRFQLYLRYTAKDSCLRNDMMMQLWCHATEAHSLLTPLGFYIMPSVQLAKSSGELRLESKDPEIQPLIDYGFLQDEFDISRLREGVRIAVGLGEHEAFRDIVEERMQPSNKILESDDALDDWIMSNVSTTMHISSTCKMGPMSDPLSVVNQQGQINGLERIRVVDASIMPDSVRANINATIIAIAERMSDLIRGSRSV